MPAGIAATVVSAAIVLGGIGQEPAATPRLTATITPNPMRAPGAPGARLSWTLEVRATGSGSVLLGRGYARLMDAAGRVVGSTVEIWSRSAGCTSCNTDVWIEDGSSRTFTDKQIVYVGGEAPVRFLYTLSFVDDLGDGSMTVEVPVHLFAHPRTRIQWPQTRKHCHQIASASHTRCSGIWSSMSSAG
jgi:hypothetical protein